MHLFILARRFIHGQNRALSLFPMCFHVDLYELPLPPALILPKRAMERNTGYFLPQRNLSIHQFLLQVLHYVTDNVCDLLQAELLIAVSRQRAIYPHHMGV